MAGAVIGALRVVLGAETGAFESGLKDAERQLGEFGSTIGKAAAAIGVAMVGAAVALGFAIRGAAQEMDTLGKAAQKIGVPVEDLSALKHAAELSDVGLEALTKGLGKLSRAMVEASNGGIEPATRAFAALGISVKNQDGTLKSSAQVMTEIAGKFAGVEDGAAKTALAIQLFGKAGAELIPLLNTGSRGLAAMVVEARELGLTIDTKTAKAAEAFNDNLKRLSRVKDGIIIQVTARLLPALERMSQSLIDAAKSSDVVRVGSEVLTRAIVFLHDNIGVLIQGLGILIGLKIISVMTGFALSFLALTRAIVAAGVATTLLNAAKTLSIAKVAAFGAIVLWATGNLPAFTEALGKVGTAVAEILPKDTTDTILSGLKALGIDIKALTGDLAILGSHTEESAGKLNKLNTELLAGKGALDQYFIATQKQITAQLADAQTIGLAIGAREKLRTQLQAEAIAKEQNIPLTEALRAKIAALGDAAAGAAVKLEGAQMTQEMLLPWDKYAQQLERINQLLAEGAISQETYGRAAQKAAADASQSQLQFASETASALTTIFKNNKAAAIAAAIINTAVAVTKALSAYPPPFSFIMAGLQAAAGAAQIAAIKAQKMRQGGSFTVPGGKGGGDVVPVQFMAEPGERVRVEPNSGPAGAAPTPINIALRSEGFTRADVIKLIGSINDLTRDGYRLNVAPA